MQRFNISIIKFNKNIYCWKIIKYKWQRMMIEHKKEDKKFYQEYQKKSNNKWENNLQTIVLMFMIDIRLWN